MENLEKVLVSLKDSRPLVKIGWTGENDARGIVWDISTWQALYGDGTCTLFNQREQDTAPYPCPVTIDGKFAVWQVADADLGSGGNGKCQLIYQVGKEVVAKSPVYRTLASKSLGDGTEPPEGTSEWIMQILQAGQDAMDAAERAEEAAAIFPNPSPQNAGKSIVVSEDGSKYELKMITGGGGGVESDQIGDGLKIVDGKLTVDVVNDVEKDNTKPITSAAVFTTVGNIDSLLQTI